MHPCLVAVCSTIYTVEHAVTRSSSVRLHACFCNRLHREIARAHSYGCSWMASGVRVVTMEVDMLVSVNTWLVCCQNARHRCSAGVIRRQAAPRLSYLRCIDFTSFSSFVELHNKEYEVKPGNKKKLQRWKSDNLDPRVSVAPNC